ncbi:MAG: restriction endonuclease [Planctomycetes bacterium]|nr:restriction endonuclease [Planctomycetota bacterium]
MHRAGASSAAIDEVTRAIERDFEPGITTRRLYKQAFKLLKQRSRPTAARYGLSRAVRSLGPDGYPFENLVAALLAEEGYRSEVGASLPGLHVQHEIDVVAVRPEKTLFVECKHRLRSGAKCDVKIALYVHARALDLGAALAASRDGSRPFDEFWLITSGEFTSDAIRYASGVDLHLLGWTFPREGGLADRIERAGLHPLTCLTTLDASQKRELLRRHFVLCRELLEKPEALDSVGVHRRSRVLKEIRGLLEGR